MLYVDTAGEPTNPAIVFLHGGGLSGRQWQPQLEALSGEFYCLAPDLPQQGRSAQLIPFTLADAAERVAQVIGERVPDGRASLVGLSLGGAVALTLAQRFPVLVDRLIVSGTSAGLGKTLAWVMRVSAATMGWFPQELLIKATFDQFAIPPQYRAALHDDLRVGVGAAFNRSVADALVRVEIPAQANALVVVGEKETIVAKRDARKLEALISGARGMVVPGVGHVWNLQAPALFTAMVRAFVRGEPLPQI